MKSSLKRLLALILAMAMALSLLSASVWAAEEETSADQSAAVEVQEEAPEESAEESAEESQEAESSQQEEEEQQEEAESSQEEEAPEVSKEKEEKQEEVEVEEESAEESVQPQYVPVNKCGENLTWSFEKGTLTITGTGAMDNYGIIPESVEGQDVQPQEGSVPPWSAESGNVVKLVVEEGVTTVGSHAFEQLDSLKLVTLPSTLQSIGNFAFHGCTALYAVELPTGLQTLGERAFENCANLNQVKNADKWADADHFDSTPWLSTLQSAQSLAEQYPNAVLLSNTEATVVSPEKSDTYTYSCVVRYQPDATTTETPKGKSPDGDWLSLNWSYDESGASCTTFVSGKTYYLYYYDNLYSNYEDMTFRFLPLGMSETTTGPYSDPLTNEGDFDDADGNVNALHWKWADRTLTISGTGVVDQNPLPNNLWNGTSKLVLENGVTGVTDLFSGSGLTSVTLADSVTNVAEDAFDGCYALVEVTKSDAVSDNCFEGTPWLALKQHPQVQELKLGETATVTVSDPAEPTLFWFSVPVVGNYSISTDQGTGLYPWVVRNNVLDTAELNPDPDDGVSEEWYLSPGAYLLWVGAQLPGSFGVTVAKANVNVSGRLGSSITWTIKDRVLTVSGTGVIDDGVWYDRDLNYDFDKLVVEEGITGIDYYAFAYSYHLKEISLPSTLKYIGYDAFYECYALNEVVIPEGVEFIGKYAFYDCYGMTKLTLPKSLKRIEYEAFYDCEALESVTLPEGLTYIGGWAFEDCYINGDLVIPSTVTYVGDGAFEDNTGLTSVTLPEGLTYLGHNAFDWCTNIRSVKLPSTIKEIPYECFIYCYGLKEVDIPEGVEVIGQEAFEYCYALKRVSLPESLKRIDYEAFNEVRGLTSIYIPASVTEFGSSIFDDAPHDFTIYGVPGSNAEKYAHDNGFRFVAHEKHSYENPAWSWSTDYSTATVMLSCGCGAQKSVEATIAKQETTTGSTKKTTYTATAALDGNTFTDTKETEEAVPQPEPEPEPQPQPQPQPEPQPVAPQNNKITLKKQDIRLGDNFYKVSKSKKQTFNLKASAKGGAKLSYKSSSKEVKVNSKGKVTIAKNYMGKVTITISSAATDAYKAAKRKVRVVVGPASVKNVKASAKDKTLKVQWDRSSKAKVYQVAWSKDKDFEEDVTVQKVKVTKKNKKDKTYSNSAKVKKGTWYVRVRSMNGRTASKWSDTVKVKVK